MRCDLGHLLLVLEELGRGGLLEGGRQRGDRVVVRAALMSREDGGVDRLLEVVPARARAREREVGMVVSKREASQGIKRKERASPCVCVRQSSARAYMISTPFLLTERTPLRKKIIAPRGPRSDLCVVVVTMSANSNGEGTTPAATRPEMCAMSASMYAPTCVEVRERERGRGVCERDGLVCVRERERERGLRDARCCCCSHLVADLAHARIVDVPRVGRGAGDNHFWAEQRRRRLERVVIDVAGRLVQSVRHRLEVDGDHRDLLRVRLEAVREVAAVWEVEAHDAVMRLADGGEDGKVGGRAGQRLHVDAPLCRVRAERAQRAVPAEVLGHVDKLVAAIVPSGGGSPQSTCWT